MSTSQIVQFTHPGSEHGPDLRNGNEKSWNTGKHKRKFLCCNGEYVSNEKLVPAKLTFWGEWEPPSSVERLTHNKEYYPKWLHRPNLKNSINYDREIYNKRSHCGATGLQNTDPFVFGDCFKYLVCKQYKQKNNTTTGLAKLERGDIILFGSTKGKKESFFQLDTVFVVAEYKEYNPNEISKLRKYVDDDYYKIAVQTAFPSGVKYKNLKLRLYKGATFNNKVNGMFSFVPSKIWNDDKEGFPRIRMENLPYITNNLNAAPRYFKNQKEERMVAIWESIRKLVKKSRCKEGVWFSY